MKNSRRFRKTKFKRRSHLAIAVLPDAEAVFAAYRLVQQHGISPEYLAIVGKGYNSPEWVGLLKPMQITFRQARSMAIATGGLGAIAGFLIILTLKVWWVPPIDLSWALFPAAILVCGFCGAVVGGLMGFFGEGSTAGIYRHHLRQGRYLLMVEGPEPLVRLSKEVLSQYSTPRAY
uniref:Uncharacterized protein n=1 Tax=Desertifilum tharense IPPAS B-1220 TaxID=1781255 RepID=A0ACD5GWD0_9CYAN